MSMDISTITLNHGQHDGRLAMPRLQPDLRAQRERHPSLDGAVNHSPSGIPTLGCVIAWAAAFAVAAVLFGSLLLLIYIEPIAEHSRPVSVEIEHRVG